MQNKTINKILVAIIITFALIMLSTYSFATLTPDQLNGEDGVDVDIDDLDPDGYIEKITDSISLIGAFIAVGVLMILGIRYMMGSIEEKATYKRSMMPYIIGCFVLFGASILVPKIQTLFTDIGTDTTTIGNTILGIIQLVGTMISVGVLMILGIKYMIGSTEERASYKKSMMPYIIGMIILFMAVNITSAIYNVIATGTVPSGDNPPIEGPEHSGEGP